MISNPRKSEKKEIEWDELEMMGVGIVGGIIEFCESCGPIIKFAHTQENLTFRLSWLRFWEYGESSKGYWGKRTNLDGYELTISRDEIKSLILISNSEKASLKIFCNDDEEYLIRINDINAYLWIEFLPGIYPQI